MPGDNMVAVLEVLEIALKTFHSSMGNSSDLTQV